MWSRDYAVHAVRPASGINHVQYDLQLLGMTKWYNAVDYQQKSNHEIKTIVLNGWRENPKFP